MNLHSIAVRPAAVTFGILRSVLLAAGASHAVDTDAAPRPNILWITSEDNSPLLGCYGDPLAQTPNLDALAREAVVYDSAFANAPVCAPTRSTIITGMYAPSIGSQHMRSKARIPDSMAFYPKFLRDAGFYTTNNAKTDYNAALPDGVWDQSSGKAHWRNRAAGQSFFAIFNLGVSHESSLHRKGEGTIETDRITVPAYQPDTPTFRERWSHYYEMLRRMDEQVGQRLAELEEAGLADDTIVFYYSDHGGPMPRGKRFLYDTGTRVPFMVRFPAKWQHLAPARPGSRLPEPVSFVDLAPTVLSLAGVSIPAYLQGQAFLGEQRQAPRQYAFLFRGRMDERIDMQRAVTDGRYKYIRNYLAYLPNGRRLEYLWRNPAMAEWARLYAEGKLDGPPRRFFEPRPQEQLFDTRNDPYELNNLAADPAHRERLLKMRAANRTHLLSIRDIGFLPEPMMQQRVGEGAAYDYAQDPAEYPQERIMAVADLTLNPGPETVPALVERMTDPEPAIRYWAVIGCLNLGQAAKAAAAPLAGLLADDDVAVRVAAAEYLGRHGLADPRPALYPVLLNEENQMARLQAASALEGTHARYAADLQVLRDAKTARPGNYTDRLLEYLAISLRDQ